VSRLGEFDQFSCAASYLAVLPVPMLRGRPVWRAKKIALTLSKQDRLRAPKKAAPRNFAAFFTVSFWKKKSNKIPAVLCRQEGRQTFAS
jgi:hypothetical protein